MAPVLAQSPLALAYSHGQSSGTEVAEKPRGGPNPISLQCHLSLTPAQVVFLLNQKSDHLCLLFFKAFHGSHFLQDTEQTPGVPEAGGQTLHDWTPACVFKLVSFCSPTTMVPGGDLSGPVPLHKLSLGLACPFPPRPLPHRASPY